MFKWLSKRMIKNNNGFTLVELVVVIAILGVLAAIAVPKLTTSRKNAAKTAHNANIKTLENAASMYIAENGVPTEGHVKWTSDGGKKASEINDAETNENNKWALYLQEWPKIPEGLDKMKDTEGNEIDSNTKYIVTIDTSGNISVTLGELSE